MKASIPSPMMSVRLSEATVALLMSQRANSQETLDAIAARLAKGAADKTIGPCRDKAPVLSRQVALRRTQADADRKYALKMLGETLRADTLGELFAKVVDALAAVDPEAVTRLEAMRSRKRAFISGNRNGIHPGRPDLPVRRSSAGWWVSDNVGTADIERALRAACKASGLSYGRDIKPLDRSGG